MWLRDQLPNGTPAALVRVITYGYDAPLIGSNSFKTVENIADFFARSLRTAGLGADRPLIFLAHSLGGIILKQMIVQLAAGPQTGNLLLHSILGGIFFGVPNWGIRNDHWLPLVEGRPNEALVRDLGWKSTYLMSLDERFRNLSILNQMSFHWGFETKTSPILIENGKYVENGEEVILVTTESATSGLAELPNSIDTNVFAIDENHSNMVKFWHGDEVCDDVVRIVREIAGVSVTN